MALLRLKFILSIFLFANFACGAGLFSQDAKILDLVFHSQIKSEAKNPYAEPVKLFFAEFEKLSKKQIKPAEKKKVGLKVYTNSGAGLSTPIDLAESVISELIARGYKRSDIYIVDMNKMRLREAGFLPTYAQMRKGEKENFKGAKVVDIDSGKYFHDKWFYDNPLLPKAMSYDKDFDAKATKEGRKSYLPIPLFLTVDFWINLPVALDLEGVGVSGALANMTIWNMSNNERFFASPANAPIAVAEVAAIPELQDSLLFTIFTFEQVQYVGGPVFNANYTAHSKDIYLSQNPVYLDFLALEYINLQRSAKGFQLITNPPILDYAKQMGLGDFSHSKMRKLSLGNL